MFKSLLPWKHAKTKVTVSGQTMDDEVLNQPQKLYPCRICSRTFLQSALKKHSPICEKTAQKKRKVFDSLRQRVEGTDLAQFHQRTYLKSNRLQQQQQQQQQQQPVHLEQKKRSPSKWVESHLRLVDAIRTAKSNTSSARSSAVSPKPHQQHQQHHHQSHHHPQQQQRPVQLELVAKKSSTTMLTSTASAGVLHSPNNERCPWCERQFGPKAFDRHVEWCKEHQARAHRSPANVQQAKERLEARTKYKVPPMSKPKKVAVREKYARTESLTSVKSTPTPTPTPVKKPITSVTLQRNPSVRKPKSELNLDIKKSSEDNSKKKSTRKRWAPKVNLPEINDDTLSLTVSSVKLTVNNNNKKVTWKELSTTNEVGPDKKKPVNAVKKKESLVVVYENSQYDASMTTISVTSDGEKRSLADVKSRESCASKSQKSPYDFIMDDFKSAESQVGFWMDNDNKKIEESFTSFMTQHSSDQVLWTETTQSSRCVAFSKSDSDNMSDLSKNYSHSSSSPTSLDGDTEEHDFHFEKPASVRKSPKIPESGLKINPYISPSVKNNPTDGAGDDHVLKMTVRGPCFIDDSLLLNANDSSKTFPSTMKLPIMEVDRTLPSSMVDFCNLADELMAQNASKSEDCFKCDIDDSHKLSFDEEKHDLNQIHDAKEGMSKQNRFKNCEQSVNCTESDRLLHIENPKAYDGNSGPADDSNEVYMDDYKSTFEEEMKKPNEIPDLDRISKHNRFSLSRKCDMNDTISKTNDSDCKNSVAIEHTDTKYEDDSNEDSKSARTHPEIDDYNLTEVLDYVGSLKISDEILNLSRPEIREENDVETTFLPPFVEYDVPKKKRRLDATFTVDQSSCLPLVLPNIEAGKLKQPKYKKRRSKCRQCSGSAVRVDSGVERILSRRHRRLCDNLKRPVKRDLCDVYLTYGSPQPSIPSIITTTTTEPYNPFECAERQFMELLECDDFKKLSSTPSDRPKTSVDRKLSFQDANRKKVTSSATNRGNKRASVIDPPSNFQDDEEEEEDDDFEMLENLINDQRRKYSDSSSIDSILINDRDGLSLPSNYDPYRSPSSSSETIRNDTSAHDRNTIPSSETSLLFSNNTARHAVEPERRRPKVPDVEAEEDDRSTVRAEDLFDVDDAMYEEYKLYEEMYLKDKDVQQQQQHQSKSDGGDSGVGRKRANDRANFGLGAGQQGGEDGKVTHNDSAYGSLSRKKTAAKLSPLRRRFDSASSQGSDKSSPKAVKEQPRPANNHNNTNADNNKNKRMSKFCHECGQKYPLNTAKFCVECGVRRLVL